MCNLNITHGSFADDKFLLRLSGDSPARAFESGNQVNGHYPCHCGTDARSFNTHVNFEKPKYLGVKERLDKYEAEVCAEAKGNSETPQDPEVRISLI